MKEANPPKLRILHLASWYPSDAHGTLGNFVQRHVESIGRMTDSEVWYVARGERRVSERMHRGIQERIAYRNGRLPWFFQVTWAMLMLARTQAKPDAIHLHVMHPAGLAARLLAWRWRVPLIATEHWTVYHPDQRTKLPHWRRALIQWVGRGVDVLCPVTEQLGASLRGFGVEAPVRVVPNVVDTDLFKPGERAVPPELLHISSLVDEQKNVTGLIEAFGAVRAELPEGTTLHVIGDGDPTPHAATAARLGLSDWVVTGGEIPLETVAERMARASAVLLFSRFENFPCVLPEAWSAGTPVLATDVGGIREHLPRFGSADAERGACVPSEDRSALGTALITLLAHPPEPQALRRYAKAHFSVPAVAQAYLQVYIEALNRG